MHRLIGTITSKILFGQSFNDMAQEKLQIIFVKNAIFSPKLQCFVADPSRTHPHLKERTYIGTARMNSKSIGLVISYDENGGYTHGYVVPHRSISRVRLRYYDYKLNPLNHDTFSNYFIWEICNGFLSTLIDGLDNPAETLQEIESKHMQNLGLEHVPREQEQRERARSQQARQDEERRQAEARKKAEEERRQAEARKNAEDENVNLADYANAETAIKYRQEAEDAWVRTSDLPADLRRRFLVALDEDPRQDIPKLLSSVEEEHKKKLRPFSDETANDALEQARTISIEAASEFKKVYDTFGDGIAAAEILEKIEHEFGPSEQTVTDLQNRVKRDKEKEKIWQKQDMAAQERARELHREKAQHIKAQHIKAQRKKLAITLYFILLIVFMYAFWRVVRLVA